MLNVFLSNYNNSFKAKGACYYSASRTDSRSTTDMDQQCCGILLIKKSKKSLVILSVPLMWRKNENKIRDIREEADYSVTGNIDDFR